MPFYPQERYQCGPAALAMMLNTQGYHVEPEALVDRVYIPGRQGTLQVELVAAARDYGLVVYPLAKNLQAMLTEVAAGNPVLIMQNLRLDWWPQWHFAVVVRFDPAQQQVIVNTDTREANAQPLTVFMNTWRRANQWAVVMLPPDRLPATAKPLDYLMAAHDLESTGHTNAAYTAYKTAAAAWPDQPAALLGLGNTAFQNAQWQLAAAHYQTMVTRFPAVPAGWNNLAYSLAKLGCEKAAREASECAVHLDGQRFDVLSNSELRASEVTGGQCPELACPP